MCSAEVETARMDAYLEGRIQGQSTEATAVKDGWRCSPVSIPVPDGQKHASESDAPRFTIPGLYHRSLVEVMKSAVADLTAERFHYIPFRHLWSPPDTSSLPPDFPIEQRIFDELYTSDAWLEEHARVAAEPRAEGDNLEHAILVLMVWSDSTHLANFGNASLWPIYTMFGNQSKYERSKPSSQACHHVAYIPSLPDSFQDFFKTQTGKNASPETITHCHRELMHAVWTLLMDDEFREAYKNGVVLKCADGIMRRLFPRLFSYSADYPEKVLLAAIRNMGICPCARCLTPKKQFSEMGTKRDIQRRLANPRIDDEARRSAIKTARKAVFELGKGVSSKAVDDLLKSKSLVPIINAFSELLAPYGLTFYDILTSDLLHEVELGSWKGLFAHLIRILIALGENRVQELNYRYRAIPTSGSGTIRRFSTDAAAMKKLAARNLEDLLQCALPVFEGLFPDGEDAMVMDLLYYFAEWHALAKLRMHTEVTLDHLEALTSTLGAQFRKFDRDICSHYATRELPREIAARQRRKRTTIAALAMQPASASDAVDQSSNSTNADITTPVPGPSVPTPTLAAPAAPAHTPVPTASTESGKPGSKATAKLKKFNVLNTYKYHVMGDYSPMIRRKSTTDNYSTQRGELEHRRVKKFYARTNKNGATKQITQLERRERLAQRLRAIPAHPKSTTASLKRKHRSVPYDRDVPEHEDAPLTIAECSYNIGQTQNFPTNLQSWLHARHDDPAVHGFLPKLQDHLLRRLLNDTNTPDNDLADRQFTDSERARIMLQHNRVYRHKMMRINYTTYDVRRGSDTINLKLHPDIMVLSHEDPQDGVAPHPFWYARILGIFHANVFYRDTITSALRPRRMEFLWVRWFGRANTSRTQRNMRRLQRIGFVPDEDDEAYGFIDPADVIRGVHLIPAFAHGKEEDVFEETAEGEVVTDKDGWNFYYVNHFVDRDMYMRFCGRGVGHLGLAHPPSEMCSPGPGADEQDLEDGAGLEDDVPAPNPAVRSGRQDSEDERSDEDEAEAASDDEIGASDDGDDNDSGNDGDDGGDDDGMEGFAEW